MTSERIREWLEYMWKQQGLFHSLHRTRVIESRKALMVERGTFHDYARRKNKAKGQGVVK